MAERVDSGAGMAADYSQSRQFVELIEREYCRRNNVDSIDKLTPEQNRKMMAELGVIT